MGIAMTVSFALSLSLTRKIEKDTSPIFNNGIRILIGVITFNVLAILNHTWRLIYTLPSWILVFLVISIICNVVIGDTLYFFAQMKIGPIYAGTMATIMPIISFLLEVFVLKRALSIWVLIASILSGIGVSIIIMAEKEKYPNDNSSKSMKHPSKATLISGLFLVFISAIAWAFGNFFIDVSLTQATDQLQIAQSVTATAFALRYNSAFILYFGFIGIRNVQKKHPFIVPKKPTKVWSIAIIAAICFTSLGTYFYGEATQAVGATYVSILNTTLPIFQFPINFLINREKMSPKGAIGCVITISGVILLLFFT